MILGWVFWIFKAGLMKTGNNSINKFGIVGVILVGSLGYTHSAAFMVRLMIPLIMIALSILAYNHSIKKKA